MPEVRHVNTYAQGLKAVKTYTAAVLIPNTYNPYFGKLVYHLHQALADRNYHMAVIQDSPFYEIQF